MDITTLAEIDEVKTLTMRSQFFCFFSLLQNEREKREKKTDVTMNHHAWNQPVICISKTYTCRCQIMKMNEDIKVSGLKSECNMENKRNKRHWAEKGKEITLRKIRVEARLTDQHLQKVKHPTSSKI